MPEEEKKKRLLKNCFKWNERLMMFQLYNWTYYRPPKLQILICALTADSKVFSSYRCFLKLHLCTKFGVADTTKGSRGGGGDHPKKQYKTGANCWLRAIEKVLTTCISCFYSSLLEWPEANWIPVVMSESLMCVTGRINRKSTSACVSVPIETTGTCSERTQRPLLSKWSPHTHMHSHEHAHTHTQTYNLFSPVARIGTANFFSVVLFFIYFNLAPKVSLVCSFASFNNIWLLLIARKAEWKVSLPRICCTYSKVVAKKLRKEKKKKTPPYPVSLLTCAYWSLYAELELERRLKVIDDDDEGTVNEKLFKLFLRYRYFVKFHVRHAISVLG